MRFSYLLAIFCWNTTHCPPAWTHFTGSTDNLWKTCTKTAQLSLTIHQEQDYSLITQISYFHVCSIFNSSMTYTDDIAHYIVVWIPQSWLLKPSLGKRPTVLVPVLILGHWIRGQGQKFGPKPVSPSQSRRLPGQCQNFGLEASSRPKHKHLFLHQFLRYSSSQAGLKRDRAG